MSTFIKTRLIKIGNSQGIRLPKLLLDQIGLVEEVELEVQPDQIVIRPAQQPRYGWEEQFQAMAKSGDDRLLDGETLSLSTWDVDEWVW